MKIFPVLFLFVIVIVTASCTDTKIAELDNYIENIKSRPKSRIENLPDFESTTSYAYVASELRNPFLPSTFGKSAPVQLCPESIRKQSQLESFPLDSLAMVGSVKQNKQRWALVRTPDNVIHRVRRDDYLGQHHGRILEVSDTAIILLEQVSDKLTGCAKRRAVLSVKE